MDGDRLVADAQGESERLTFEQLNGELDAAIVFAAAAQDADRDGRAALAQACRIDASDAYAAVLARLAEPDITETERRALEAKLLRVREMLDRPRPARTPATHEAA